MVRPIALRLTLPESKLLEAWVEARKRSDKSASASDVIRRALVAAAFAAHDRDEWTRIANEDRALEEWTARADSLLTVPWFEIVLGAGLIAQVARTALAWTAVAVLAVFAVVLGSHLVRGRRPPCACFGGRHPRPISWWHVARNLALIAIAVVAAA